MALSFGLGLPPAPKKGGSFYADWPLAFDFVNNKYRVGIGRGYSSSFLEQPGVTYARTGADLLSYNPVTGKWQAFAANAPALLTGAGQDIPEGTTNKCTNYNAAPTDLTNVSKSGDAAAVLSVVDDTAALIAAGFGDLIDAGKMSGMVYRLDNSLGSTNAFASISGAVGNINAHTFSIYARNSGSLRLELNGGTGSTLFSASSGSYIRRVVTITPANSAQSGLVNALPGSVIYFILNQLEEKTYATNPVIVSGAAATRGNAQPVVTGLSSILTPPFTLVAVANLSAIDGVNRVLLSAAEGPSVPANRMFMRRDSGGLAANALNAGGVSQPALSFPNKNGPRLIKYALRFRAGTFSASCDGVLAGPQAITNPTGQAQLFMGYSYDASQWLNSPLLFVGIAPDLTDAQLQALTASNGALTDFL